MKIIPDYSAPLDERIECFEKDVELLEFVKYNSLPIRNYFKVLPKKRENYIVKLCFKEESVLTNFQRDEIEGLFIKHFGEGGMPVLQTFPCSPDELL